MIPLTQNAASEISQWEYEKPYDAYNFKDHLNGYLLDESTWGTEQFCLANNDEVIGQVSCQLNGADLWVGWSMTPQLCGKGNGAAFIEKCVKELRYKMYDKIEDTESLLIEARAKKTAIEAEKLTADNIYKVLIYFDKLYAVMDEQEHRQLMESLISEIHIFGERKPNGQWLKSIKFKLPIIEEDMEISLDNDTQVECMLLMSKGGK